MERGREDEEIVHQTPVAVVNAVETFGIERCALRRLITQQVREMLESFFHVFVLQQASHTSPTLNDPLKIFCSIFFVKPKIPFLDDQDKKKKKFSYLRTRHVCLRYCRNPSVHRHAPSRQPLLATRIEHCSSFMQSFPKS